jgi:hypothetical protein
MALVTLGNPLTSKFIQPGATYEHNGYGLLTSKSSFILDNTVGGTAIVPGQDHPVVPELKVHRYVLTRNDLRMDQVDVEYMGIGTPFGARTRPNVTASHGLTSENITTHPNFFGAGGIAGNGTTFVRSTIVEGEWVGGDFGAHFKGTATNAGGFTGFKDSSTASKQYFYGKNQYLAPTTSFSGHIYTTTAADVTALRNAVGKTSTTNNFAGIKLLPDHMGTTWTASVKGTERATILLSQVSFEDFCLKPDGVPLLFKVNYEIRFNRDGYPAEVYPAS